MSIFGSLLMVVGVVALLDNFDILPGGFWEFFWPILLIVLGISIVSRGKSHNSHWGFTHRKKGNEK